MPTYYLPIIITVAALAGGAAFWLLAVSWAARRRGYVESADTRWGEL